MPPLLLGASPEKERKPLNNKDNSVITRGKLMNRYFVLLLITGICLNLDHNLMTNSVTLYLTHLGKSTGISGLIGIPFAIAAIISRIVGGYLTDHLGRRVTMAAGCFIFGLTVIFFGLTGSVALLFILRAVHGVGYSLANTPMSAATMDVCPPEKQKQASGLFYLPFAVSLSVSGAVSVIFAEKGLFREFYLVLGAVLLVGGVIALACNYEKLIDFRAPSGEKKYRGLSAFFDKGAIPAAILSVIGCFSTAFLNSFILLYASEQGFDSSGVNTGLFFTVTAVIMLVMNLSVDAILKKLSETVVLAVIFVLLAVGFVVQSITGSVAGYFILAVCYGVFSGLAFPLFYSLALRDALPERRGAASGTVLVANDIGIGLGSAAWGVVIGFAGYSASLVIVAAVLVLGAVYAVVHYGRKK